MAKHEAHDLWAITCYFNPMAYERKLANYRVFRKHLSIPLVAVELAYGPTFELNEDDADILLRLRGRDVLWQKERLLNLALQALPDSCSKVAWIDCDVVFESGSWAQRTCQLLDHFLLVQPYSHLHRPPKEWQPRDERSVGSVPLLSVPFLMQAGMTLDALRNWSEYGGYVTGYVWAAGREVLEQHGFYDAFIIGGGDGAIVRAAYGCFEDMARLNQMHRRQSDHYLAWAATFHDAVQAKIGVVEGNLLHLWHGEIQHRRYSDRWSEFRRFYFDPFEDIALDQHGVWRWNTDKHQMHDFVRRYFASRREDD